MARSRNRQSQQPVAPQRPRLALSVRQPFAEFIMRGSKPIEYRSRRTHIRGRIYLYASQGRYPQSEEARWAEEYRLNIDDLPRGVLIGTVELWGCRDDDEGDYEWLLRAPRRLGKAMAPEGRPNSVWFRPFD